MRVLYVSLSVIIIDQLTKLLVKGIHIALLGINIKGVDYGVPRQIFGEGVRLLYIENPGMAFGLTFIPKLVLIFITIAASILITYYLFRNRKSNLMLRLALAFILGGAMGNLIDRIFYGLIYGYAPVFFGRVVDFIQIAFFNFTFLGKTYTSWPILNFADLSVTIGFLIMLVFNNRILKPAKETQTGLSINNEIQVDCVSENRTE